MPQLDLFLDILFLVIYIGVISLATPDVAQEGKRIPRLLSVKHFVILLFPWHFY